MGDQFRNSGPAAKVKSAENVTLNGYNYNAREMLIINEGGTTNNFNGTNTVSSTLEPRAISFRNIPEPHGSFIGRVEYIKSVIKYLSCPVVAEVQIQFPFLLIHALGGYGKTQTARKIASVCRNERTFQHFIWIDSEDHDDVKKSFVAVMIQVGLNASVKTDALNFDLLLHQFYNLLASLNHEKFLIIFDNVEDFDNIMKFLPLNRSVSNIAVLMTSRRSFTRESYGHIRNQPLDLMREEEAIRLVENILGTSTMDSEEDKKLLVEQSGRIALVLCVMTSTIKLQRRYKSDYKIKDYLKEMGDEPIKYSDKSKQLDLDYDKCLQKIVQFAVDKLNNGAPIEKIAVNIFDRLVYLPSGNYLGKRFVDQYFCHVCVEAKNVDMQLPIKPVDNRQLIRMAIEKLSEFSLGQIENKNIFSVHRWIQASRRLDLKASGDDEVVLKKLLICNKLGEIDFTVWEHIVADCPQLVNEFYAEKRTLRAFPIRDVDFLEKVIHILTQREDFQPFENYDEDIVEMICRQFKYEKPDKITRVVNLFDYDMSKKARKFMSTAISYANFAIFKWLVNEKSLIPEKIHLIECVSIWTIGLGRNLANLKKVSIEYTLKSSSGCTCGSYRRCILHEYHAIKNATEGIELLYLVDSDPLKIHLSKIIEENCGKYILHEMLSFASESIDSRQRFGAIQVFETMRIIWSALKKLEPNIKSDEIYEMYSENNLLECFFFCGQAHFTKSHSKWISDTQRDAFKHKSKWIKRVDTPLLIAVKDGACEATTVLLENYSGDVNVVDDFGETALSYAIKLCRASICKCLLSYKARTSWKKQNGASVQALHIAVKTFRDLQGSEPDEIIYAILTSKDCDVCAVDDLGNNILHLLVRYYYATRYTPNNNALQFILSAYPNLIDMRNNEGFTPFQLVIGLHDQFSQNHWHRASLQSFISMVQLIPPDGLDVEFSPSAAKIPRHC